MDPTFWSMCYACLFMYALKYNIVPKKIRHWSHIFLRHCCVLETMMRVFFNKGMLIKAAVLDKRAMTEKSIRSFHCSMRTASLASLKIIWPPVQNGADVTIQSCICIFFFFVCVSVSLLHYFCCSLNITDSLSLLLFIKIKVEIRRICHVV